MPPVEAPGGARKIRLTCAFFEPAARVAATAPIDRQYGEATSDSSVSRARRNVLRDFELVILHS